uniref:Large ribosomal subunit protein uL24c n=1 Tax=Dipterosiphonia australica TaxID=2007208 RepID=A0A1Z1MM02_9FLOR|nr:ribosomal protein L24 [Dipterosiphonia australica]ARW66879.1 ribosomal protein L24 [Dipterosiphonia australica]
MKIQVKKGDDVKIISGRNKGKSGKVLSIIRNKGQVIIENTNIKIKHIKPKQTNEQGHIAKIEGPIHHSNIKIIKANKSI